MVKWQRREIVDGYYPRNKFSWKPEFMQINWPLGKLRKKEKRKVPIWNTRQFSVSSGCTSWPHLGHLGGLLLNIFSITCMLGWPMATSSPSALQRLACKESLDHQRDLSTTMLSRLKSETVNRCGQPSCIHGF